MRYDLIVFDWDGTLLDSAALIAETLRMACTRMGIATPPEAHARHVIGMGMMAALQYVAPELPPERLPELFEHYRAHYLPREHQLRPFAGVAELLQQLDADGYLLAVATGKPRVGLERGFAATGFKTHFVASRCADESRPKPDPDMLLHLMAVTGTTPQRTLMIGDTSHDLMMAHHAGVDAVAVSYGAHPRAFLEQHPALVVLDSVPDLARWLGAQD